MAWVVGRCWRSGEIAEPSRALLHQVRRFACRAVRLAPPPTAEHSAWKSIPVLVRLGIWLIVLPPLLWFGSCAACTLVAALSGHS